MHLLELVVIGRIRDRREMKDRVDHFLAELLPPVERRQILRKKIATVTREILEITRAKVIDHRQTRVRKFFLQRQREIGPDEACAASDDEILRRVQF